MDAETSVKVSHRLFQTRACQTALLISIENYFHRNLSQAFYYGEQNVSEVLFGMPLGFGKNITDVLHEILGLFAMSYGFV